MLANPAASPTAKSFSRRFVANLFADNTQDPRRYLLCLVEAFGIQFRSAPIVANISPPTTSLPIPPALFSTANPVVIHESAE